MLGTGSDTGHFDTCYHCFCLENRSAKHTNCFKGAAPVQEACSLSRVQYLFKGAKQGSAKQLIVRQLHTIAHMPLRQCCDLRNEAAQVPKAFDDHPQLLHDLQSMLAQQLHPKKRKIHCPLPLKAQQQEQDGHKAETPCHRKSFLWIVETKQDQCMSWRS